ncbi:MAG TPA: hypothetical protein VGK67_35115 [Myxococcales bacterium]|jgi:hypothetical protein
MVLFWFALSIAVAGQLVVAGQFVADACRGKTGTALAKAVGMAFASYLVLPVAAVLSLRRLSWFVVAAIVLVSSAGAPALLRIVQVHGRPVWPHLRDGLRAAFKPSWRAWATNAVISIGILAAVLKVVSVFEKRFKDIGGTLPAPTQLLIDDCGWLQRSIVALPFALAGLHVFCCWWEGLIRAGARTAAPVGWFRNLVGLGMILYVAAALFALALPVKPF